MLSFCFSFHLFNFYLSFLHSQFSPSGKSSSGGGSSSSSIGTVPVDLGGVYLATGASGKGLASVAGLGFVFYIDELLSADHNLPRYFDLSYYARNEGVPFTSSSNLVAALHKALDRLKPDRRFQGILNMSAWLRNELRSRGFQLMADDEALEQFAKTAAVGVWHASCTCRMGADDDSMAVTDRAGRLRGVEGLRVVDASLFPVVPCANTNFPTLMVAEKISDDILQGQ